MQPYTETANTEYSGLGFQATYVTASPISQSLRHLPVSTSQIRTVPSDEPVKTITINDTDIEL